jgi:creatinine amidohydrolase
MTMLEAEARLKENDLIIIPVGRTEARGPHACYGEDTFLVTQRLTQEEVDEFLIGPLNGGKHLYTIAWPPC